MKIKIKEEDFRIKEGEKTNVTKIPTRIDKLYSDQSDYEQLLDSYKREIFELQNIMYAHDRYSLLLVFQGMDTAGKDGAIRHVMSGVNPAGVMVSSFKKPSSNELDHDYMWRCVTKMPQRGRIGIFNRSYYEEVLVVKVHPKILTYQKIPSEFIKKEKTIWERRYRDITEFEKYQHHNGTKIIKFFLHISKEEQRERLLERIDTPAKNWKMSPADVEERKYWDDYQDAFSDCLENTSTKNSPWYVIPGDSKKNARLIISQIILENMKKLDMRYPVVTEDHKKELLISREILMKDL